VLAAFKAEEQAAVTESVKRAAKVLACWITDGMEAAMRAAKG